MSEVEPTFEHWTYGGLRVRRNGDRCHSWLPLGSDPDIESELWYPAKKNDAIRVIGGNYRVKVVRHDGKITLYADAEYMERHDDAELRALLEVRHRTADTRLRTAAIEKSDKRKSALDEALEPLLAIAAKTPTFDRDALAMYVTRRIALA